MKAVLLNTISPFDNRGGGGITLLTICSSSSISSATVTCQMGRGIM